MALVTTRLSDIDEGLVQLFVTYDDAVDADGEWVGALDSFRLLTSIPVTLQVVKRNGQPWKTVAVDPGDYTYPAGGPVRTWDDLSRISLRM